MEFLVRAKGSSRIRIKDGLRATLCNIDRTTGSCSSSAWGARLGILIDEDTHCGHPSPRTTRSKKYANASIAGRGHRLNLKPRTKGLQVAVVQIEAASARSLDFSSALKSTFSAFWLRDSNFTSRSTRNSNSPSPTQTSSRYILGSTRQLSTSHSRPSISHSTKLTSTTPFPAHTTPLELPRQDRHHREKSSTTAVESQTTNIRSQTDAAVIHSPHHGHLQRVLNQRSLPTPPTLPSYRLPTQCRPIPPRPRLLNISLLLSDGRNHKALRAQQPWIPPARVPRPTKPSPLT